MDEQDKKPTWWHRIIQKLTATGPVTRFLAPRLHRLDSFVLDNSGGRWTATTLLTGLPVIWLTTTGARSGEQRTTPLVCLKDGERLALIATSFGRPRHPGWYYNLRANPQVNVSSNGSNLTYTAHEVDGEERNTYWQQAVAQYPGYRSYRDRAGDREIPVIVLTPVDMQT
jgi:deazaflavin-dependent oxidoreductase (nitroreductase family)